MSRRGDEFSRDDTRTESAKAKTIKLKKAREAKAR